VDAVAVFLAEVEKLAGYKLLAESTSGKSKISMRKDPTLPPPGSHGVPGLRMGSPTPIPQSPTPKGMTDLLG